MKTFALLYVSVTLIQLSRSDKILVDFIRDYYEASNIHQIVIFACWDYAVEVSRNIMGLDTVVTYQSTTDDINLTDILRVNYYHLGIVLDFDCPFSERIIDKFSDHLPFNESYHWLILSNLSPIPKDYLESLALTIASELTSAIRKGNQFQLYDIYNPSYRHGGSVNVVDKGQWTPNDGLQNKLSEYKYIRRADLQQLCLNFSVVLYYPPLPDLMTYLSTYMHIKMDTMTRAHYPVAMYLQDMYNFSIKIHQATTWGYLVNGSFNGLIGDIISGFIDMSLTPFEFHGIRMDFVEYAVETWYADVSFTFLHPKTSALQQHYEATTQDTEMNVIDTGLTTVAALSQQGLSESPMFFSGRITFLSLFFWALLLYQFYSASIVSSLMTAPPRWIKTIKDISDSELEVASHFVQYYHNLFKTSTDPDVIELYNRKIKSRPNRFLSVEEGFRKVQGGGYAYLTETTATYPLLSSTFSEDQICAVEEIRLRKPRSISLIMPKNSPFKKIMNYGLRKIVQSGIMHRLQKIWRGARPRCPENYNDRPTPMGMTEFSPAIFLLCIGLIIAMAILVMENLYFYFENRHRSLSIDAE
ncbi:ionotropic receptor 75a-like isoform X2 [Diachasmimorpha longicaudata]|uniref:ionotropic receptor 75a-like isoform X2 n=1 Tax=Diachasmimorpha longicaudata TaxID=58733 RepID=UPI0030B88540